MKIGDTIQVRVIPSAKKVQVKEADGIYKVYLTAAPIEGKANKALIQTLADYFKVKRSQVSIIKGEKSRDKVIRINKGP